MSIIVQKFGGTSVADSQLILAAARKAIRAQRTGHEVVVVVSAMGQNTDLLIDLAKEIHDRPPAREMDMLMSTGEQVSAALMAMAVEALGYRAVSLTGAQIGIRTDSTHTKARIRSISTERMQALLDTGNIVIAAGFQGIDEERNITTLGRGGSDTTAVALAAVLHAAECEIYTDVDGVYTTDPRILPEARRVERISYDEMLELASLGAGVMHNRSIEFAKRYGVPIHVRSSLSDTPGTLICSEPEVADRAVCGAAVMRNEARIALVGVPDVPGTSLEIFSRLADRKITVDMIVQNVGEAGKSDISFTVPRDELPAALEAVREAADIVGVDEINTDENVSKVSVVGLGMARQAGVADKMFAALAAEGINIQMITTSEIKISTLVEQDAALPALRAVHRAFELEREPALTSAALGEQPTVAVGAGNGPDFSGLVERLKGTDMEELMLDDISLDQSQALVTIAGVPDRPGVAAAVFRSIGNEGIFVDMIVQSHKGAQGQASLSFTVPAAQLTHTLSVARRLADAYQCRTVMHSPSVAKLSVSGIGLRSHTSVAIRMFRALADAGINVDMISTSELRVNVVIDGRRGERGLAQLQKAFEGVLR
ncbi:MAG: aspartate kinase [Planctomycetes bacterium]|nr:aspartate kinase [Planctomycetota bacterium]